ncbi:MAG: Cys-tRNA(Pro) deacylase [Oscillospiraceae bacterium]|nr:Cys-tRNA(Pro) deacylase [Oscillospiraceae bacterium]
MRILEQAGIPFTTASYDYDENDLSGTHAADSLGLPYERVFKTLVARGAKNNIYVFCIPVCCELDLKKAARAAGDKSVELIHVKELLGITGYIRGGCSPVGMKKKYPTIFDETALLYETISVSAGIRGTQMTLSPVELMEFIEAAQADIASQSV